MKALEFQVIREMNEMSNSADGVSIWLDQRRVCDTPGFSGQAVTADYGCTQETLFSCQDVACQ